jgi:hypothetical protein
MDREKTIVVLAVAVTAVTLIGGLFVLLFGLFAAPTIRTVITPPPPVTAVPLATPPLQSNQRRQLAQRQQPASPLPHRLN